MKKLTKNLASLICTATLPICVFNECICEINAASGPDEETSSIEVFKDRFNEWFLNHVVREATNYKKDVASTTEEATNIAAGKLAAHFSALRVENLEKGDERDKDHSSFLYHMPELAFGILKKLHMFDNDELRFFIVNGAHPILNPAPSPYEELLDLPEVRRRIPGDNVDAESVGKQLFLLFVEWNKPDSSANSFDLPPLIRLIEWASRRMEALKKDMGVDGNKWGWRSIEIERLREARQKLFGWKQLPIAERVSVMGILGQDNFTKNPLMSTQIEILRQQKTRDDWQRMSHEEKMQLARMYDTKSRILAGASMDRIYRIIEDLANSTLGKVLIDYKLVDWYFKLIKFIYQDPGFPLLKVGFGLECRTSLFRNLSILLHSDKFMPQEFEPIANALKRYCDKQLALILEGKKAALNCAIAALKTTIEKHLD
jgi:hypothetical protein